MSVSFLAHVLFFICVCMCVCICFCHSVQSSQLPSNSIANPFLPPLPTEINGPARYSYLKADSARKVVTSVFDHGSLIGNIRDVYECMGRDIAKTLAVQDRMQADAEQKEALAGALVV